MPRSSARLLLTTALLSSAAFAADITVHDAEATRGWDNVTLSDEAKVGAHAVTLAVPAGKAGGTGLNLRNLNIDFSRGGTIKFWYRLRGTGQTSLMFKLVTPTFSDNYQCVWEVFPNQTADGQWRQATLSLTKGFQKWGNAPETGSNYAFFRTLAGADANLQLDIDDVIYSPDANAPVAALAATTPTQPAATINGAETMEGWDNVTLSDEAKVGAHAVTLAVPVGKAGGTGLNLRRSTIDFSKGGGITFWYRLRGTGKTNLMVKLVNPTFQNNYQCVWEVFPAQTGDGQWHQGVIDLTSGFQKWGNAPETGSNYLYFRTASTGDSDLKLDIDEIAYTPEKPKGVQTASTPSPGGTNIAPADPARVKQIAALLDPKPRGLNFTINDREPWQALGATDEYKDRILPRAIRFLTEPIPVVDQATYDAAVQSGSRDIQAPIDRRRFRLIQFVLAEGVENQGRFIPAIEKELAAICSEKSWIIAAHVKFTGKNDLGSAMTSWIVASTVSVLDNKLSDATRNMVRDNVIEKVTNPYLAQVRDPQAAPDFWRNSGFNWNAVVHAGITGAALAVVDSVQDRAEIVANAEKQTQVYLNGFPKDGYSTEGMGYWNYGFGHYIMLSEAVYIATGGKLNLYARDPARLIAQFPRRFEVAPDIYPAYSDSRFANEPVRWLYYIIDQRYGLNDQSPRTLTVDGANVTFLYAWAMNLAFKPGKLAPAAAGADNHPGYRIRDWFPDAQIYVGRPTKKIDGLAISMKGGNNGTSHNHNDLGTYLLLNGTQPLIVDPGSTVYNAATFGAQRFQNEVINSYGHAVPLVAGKLQGTGEKFKASIVDSKFTDATDTVTFDLSKGYEVDSLQKLQRALTFDRAGKGKVTIADAVEFNSAQTFGTALITFGEATEEKPGTWIIAQNGKSVRAEIDAGGQAFTVTNKILKDESAAGKVRRLGIDLNAPTSKATITVKVTPVN